MCSVYIVVYLGRVISVCKCLMNHCLSMQSLDYDPCENNLLQDEERNKGYKFVVKKNIARWFLFFLIGICTALIACFIDISIEEISVRKYGYLKYCILSDVRSLYYFIMVFVKIFFLIMSVSD